MAKRWQRLGYPFDSLTPSYATAIGASGDRPAALSELAGIILGNGVDAQPSTIRTLAFAADTPYATTYAAATGAGQGADCAGDCRAGAAFDVRCGGEWYGQARSGGRSRRSAGRGSPARR